MGILYVYFTFMRVSANIYIYILLEFLVTRVQIGKLLLHQIEPNIITCLESALYSMRNLKLYGLI